MQAKISYSSWTAILHKIYTTPALQGVLIAGLPVIDREQPFAGIFYHARYITNSLALVQRERASTLLE